MIKTPIFRYYYTLESDSNHKLVTSTDIMSISLAHVKDLQSPAEVSDIMVGPIEDLPLCALELWEQTVKVSQQ